MEAKPFGAESYVGQVAPSRRSAAVIAPLVMDLLTPATVLDIGCGAGSWMAEFRAAGADVLGVEGGHPDSADLQVPADLILSLDLREPVDLGRRFDLIVSVEVAEHIPEAAADQYLAGLDRHGDAVLFSAAVPGQGGTYHVNEQWPDYWAERFAVLGFDCFDPFRLALWQDDRIEWWYRQNLLLMARGDAAERLRRAGHEPGSPRRLVTADLFEQTRDWGNREHGLREQVAGLAQAVKGRLARR